MAQSLVPGPNVVGALSAEAVEDGGAGLPAGVWTLQVLGRGLNHIKALLLGKKALQSCI